MRRISQTKESLKDARSALEAETREVVQVSNRLNDNLEKTGRIIWRQLLFIWTVLIVLAVSYFLVLNNATVTKTLDDKDVLPPHPSSAPAETGSHSPAAAPQFPASPTIPAKEDVLKLLNQIREAQLKQDIDLFLRAYSPTFPNLAQKRERTLAIWRKYDYLESQFQVIDMSQYDKDSIIGHVTWQIKARDHKTNSIKEFSKSYSVAFSDQSGTWLIQKLEPLDGKPE
jgi:hypothetical protein